MRRTAAKALFTIDEALTIRVLSENVITGEVVLLRMRAAEALGYIGDARAIRPLSQALTDGDSGVRRVAAWALGCIGDPRAIEPLLAALTDKDNGVRISAAYALGAHGCRKALPALRARLHPIRGEHDKWIRPYIRAAIDCIEQATADTAGLPRAAEPEAPDAAKRPRAGEDADF